MFLLQIFSGENGESNIYPTFNISKLKNYHLQQYTFLWLTLLFRFSLITPKCELIPKLENIKQNHENQLIVKIKQFIVVTCEWPKIMPNNGESVFDFMRSCCTERKKHSHILITIETGNTKKYAHYFNYTLHLFRQANRRMWCCFRKDKGCHLMKAKHCRPTPKWKWKKTLRKYYTNFRWKLLQLT